MSPLHRLSLTSLQSPTHSCHAHTGVFTRLTWSDASSAVLARCISDSSHIYHEINADLMFTGMDFTTQSLKSLLTDFLQSGEELEWKYTFLGHGSIFSKMSDCDQNLLTSRYFLPGRLSVCLFSSFSWVQQRQDANHLCLVNVLASFSRSWLGFLPRRSLALFSGRRSVT